MLGALHALLTLIGSAGTLLLPNIMDRGLTIAQYIHQTQNTTATKLDFFSIRNQNK
jgi:hypothetical protein